jgi:hypothetical protein
MNPPVDLLAAVIGLLASHALLIACLFLKPRHR